MIYRGDLFDVLPTLESDSVDACVTDPPYELGFMGKRWDARGVAFNPDTWRAVYRVLKPGAHLLAFGGTRTFHRMTCAIEDAGFEIRDCLSYLFGQGFPKSLNFGCKCGGNALSYNHADSTSEPDLRPLFGADVSEAVNAGYESGQVLLAGLPEQGAPAYGPPHGAGFHEGREQPGMEGRQLHRAGEGLSPDSDAGSSASTGERLRAGARRCRRDDSRATPEAERGSASQGSGSGEQSSGQPADLRLPPGALDGGTSERCSRCERCGGLTAARGLGTALKPGWEPIIVARKPTRGTIADNFARYRTGALNIDACRIGTAERDDYGRSTTKADGSLSQARAPGYGLAESPYVANDLGRWPANVLLDDEAAEILDHITGCIPASFRRSRTTDPVGATWAIGRTDGRPFGHLDSGGASRFFYCAKPSREERDLGCNALPPKSGGEATDREDGTAGLNSPRAGSGRTGGSRNHHPTVKPIALMRWLVRLVTPPDGVVLDPFMGSGTTGMACRLEQRRFIGIEREAEYVEIAERRIAAVVPLFSGTQP